MTQLYRLFLSTIATRGRIIGLVALGLVTVVVGFAIGANDISDHLDDGTNMDGTQSRRRFAAVAAA